ncbi:MAG TPA: hypoxanthine phosphoribosyltransferase [Terriglobia bacterium]|jgi:hypoxanthine phosphoribosyltransferase|nr:hypoxanthine phosphoribosyltransferase [Terriglobia bacterium]
MSQIGQPTPPPHPDPPVIAGTEVLISADRIAARVRELAAEISRDYQGRNLRLVGVLKGAFVFLSDLLRAIDHPDVTLDFLGVATYGNASQTSGEVRVTKDLDKSVEGLNVLVVEDILDTGVTFHYLLNALRNRKPSSLRTVTLLDKPSRRIRPVQADYVGFSIPDAFVVGYGLDFAEKYRQLPYIGVLKP